jgi:hypothetical protein
LRILLASLVLLLNAWALVGVAALPSRRQRLRWMALIVLAPVIGAWLWWRRRKEAAA